MLWVVHPLLLTPPGMEWSHSTIPAARELEAQYLLWVTLDYQGRRRECALGTPRVLCSCRLCLPHQRRWYED